MASKTEVIHDGVVGAAPEEDAAGVVNVAQMHIGVCHVMGSIDNDYAAGRLAFSVAHDALCVGGCAAGDVVGPLGEFRHDGANTVVVVDQTLDCTLGKGVATYATGGAVSDDRAAGDIMGIAGTAGGMARHTGSRHRYIKIMRSGVRAVVAVCAENRTLGQGAVDAVHLNVFGSIVFIVTVPGCMEVLAPTWQLEQKLWDDLLWIDPDQFS